MFITGFRFNNKVCLALILIWCVPLLVFAQFEGKEFVHYSTKDGLTDNSITALAQDRFGYMWIGTERGLGRFDGLNVKQYHSESNKESLPSEDILNLQWIDSNTLVIITRQGINLINIQTMKQCNLLVPGGVLKNEDRVNKMRGLLTDKAGNYFITTRTGFYHFNSKKELVFRYDDYTRENIESSAAGFGVFFGWLDAENIIVTGQFGVYHYNTQARTFSKITGTHTAFSVFGEINKLGKRNYTIRQPWPGRFILFLYAADTAIYIDETKDLVTYSHFPNLLKGNEIGWRSDLFVMKDSSLFLSGKNSGIFKLHLNSNTGSLFPDTVKMLEKKKCNDFFTDKHGRLWIALNEGLLMEKNSPVNLQLIRMPDTIPAYNPLTSIKQIVTDEKYIYATGTQSGGLYVFNKKDMSFVKKVSLWFSSGVDKSVHALKKWGQDTILCGANGGLFWYNSKNQRKGFIDLPGWDIKHNWIAKIDEDKRKNLWIFSNKSGGCYLYQSKNRKYEWFPFKQSLVKNIQVVYRMAEDSKGNIWMGGNGLARYNTAKVMFDLYVDSFPAFRFQAKGVSALAIDKDDNLWLGNSANGLILFEPGKMRFTPFSRPAGLPDNQIMALKITDSSLWISCKSGIARMDIKSRKIFNTSNNRELLFNYVSGNTLFSDDYSGMLYTGIGSGIIRFGPGKKPYTSEPPNLVVENILMGKDSVSWNPSGVISTTWRNKNIIVSFTAINYHDASDQRYAYRIVNGEDTNWILLEEQRRIVFSNLTSGTHQVEIKTYSLNNRWETPGNPAFHYYKTAVLENMVVLPAMFIDNSRSYLYPVQIPP